MSSSFAGLIDCSIKHLRIIYQNLVNNFGLCFRGIEKLYRDAVNVYVNFNR